VRAVLGFLLILVGVTVGWLVLSGKLPNPGAVVTNTTQTTPDPKSILNNTAAQNLSLDIFGMGHYTVGQQQTNAATESKQNVGTKPGSGGKCPAGYSYLPWDGKCYPLAGI